MVPYGDPLLWYAEERLEEFRKEAARQREARWLLADDPHPAAGEEGAVWRLAGRLLRLIPAGPRPNTAAKPEGPAVAVADPRCCETCAGG